MRRYKLGKMFFLIMAIVLLNVQNVMAYTEKIPVVDMDRIGSLLITMQDAETLKLLTDGSLTLYHVADVHLEKDADYSYVLTEDFADMNVDLKTLDADLANRFASYIEEKKIAGLKQSVNDSGKVEFDNLELGLYLIVQEEATQGYYKIKPFLVSVPLEENNEFIYDVNATPKMETLKKVPQTPDIQLTGDETQVEKWIMILGASCIILCGILLLSRKKLKRT